MEELEACTEYRTIRAKTAGVQGPRGIIDLKEDNTGDAWVVGVRFCTAHEVDPWRSSKFDGGRL